MSESAPSPLSQAQIERIRQDAQILKETGISANYFNDVVFYGNTAIKEILHPEIKLRRFEYLTPEETAMKAAERAQWAREKVAEFLPKIRTYSEYIEVARGTLPKEIWITKENTERISQIDEKIIVMRSLIRENLEDIDLSALTKLAFEVACLIYGADKEERFRKNFLELGPRD